MARTHTECLMVRDSDLDSRGELRAAAAIGLFQDVAVQASTAAGFGPEWYLERGSTWVARRVLYEPIEPVRTHATLELETWVADFRRVRSLRRYEMRSEGRRVARAETDWVYLDRATGRPARVPAEMEGGFLPDSAEDLPPRRPLRHPDPPAGAFRRQVVVTDRDLDSLHHVNNSVWVAMATDSIVARDDGRGWLGGEEPQKRITRFDIEYFREARWGDEIDFFVWPLDGESPDSPLALVARSAAGVHVQAVGTVLSTLPPRD